MWKIKGGGFSLVVLFVFLLIIGILAITAPPRPPGPPAPAPRGFYDETLAALRYAQKTAIAQRRNVCITFGANSVSLSIASSSGGSQPCTGGSSAPLSSLSGSGNFIVTGRAGTAFASPPASFQFDAQGRPRTAANVSIGPLAVQVSGFPTSITIEQETGYVHS